MNVSGNYTKNMYAVLLFTFLLTQSVMAQFFVRGPGGHLPLIGRRSDLTDEFSSQNLDHDGSGFIDRQEFIGNRAVRKAVNEWMARLLFDMLDRNGNLSSI